jgi:hypothetical protein
MSVVRFYTYRDMVLIPTVAQAEEGFYIDVDPVTVCDTSNEQELRAALQKALATDNPVVPTPEPTDEPGSVILEKLGLRKWLLFEAEAMMYTVHCNPHSFECYSTGRAVNGTWQRRQSKHMTFERDQGLTPLLNAVIADIGWEKEAAIAAEQAKKSGGLMLLPPPEN